VRLAVKVEVAQEVEVKQDPLLAVPAILHQ